jgi:hypothetical protein
MVLVEGIEVAAGACTPCRTEYVSRMYCANWFSSVLFQPVSTTHFARSSSALALTFFSHSLCLPFHHLSLSPLVRSPCSWTRRTCGPGRSPSMVPSITVTIALSAYYNRHLTVSEVAVLVDMKAMRSPSMVPRSLQHYSHTHHTHSNLFTTSLSLKSPYSWT